MNESAPFTNDPQRRMLRHTLATLAYRGGKAVSGAPLTFGAFRVNDTTRTPLLCSTASIGHAGFLLFG
jgi:hypothetical protein